MRKVTRPSPPRESSETDSSRAHVIGLTPSPSFVPPVFHLDGPPPAHNIATCEEGECEYCASYVEDCTPWHDDGGKCHA